MTTVPTRPAPASLIALVVVNAIAGFLTVLAGAALLFDAAGDPGASAVGIALVALGVAGGLAGFLLHRRRLAGRRLQIGLAAAGLALFPFWTAASLWTLVTMFRRAERTLLSGRDEEGWTPEEDSAVRALPAVPSVRRAVLTATGLLLLLALEAGLLLSLPEFGAVERSRQKRTMSDMRSAMTAIESYAAEERAYPATSSMEDLARLLEPSHVRLLPRTDAWGHPLRYEAWKERPESPGPDAYFLASPGKDGAWQVPDPRTVAPGPARTSAADIVIRNGDFVRFPEGAVPSAAR